MVHFRGIKKLVEYGLKRIDYVNPANKLVNKYAPPNYRPGLFKLVKASELFLGGKTAYDIYNYLTAPDTPGNGSFSPYVKRTPSGTPYKTRSGYPRRKRSRSKYCKPTYR